MRKSLIKIYIILLIPAIILTAISYIAVMQGIVMPGIVLMTIPYRVITPIVVILSALFGIALPLFYRSFFAHRMQGMTAVSPDTFYRFERNLLILAMMCPYTVAGAILLGLMRYHLYAVLIFALYAAYYYFPSQRRIALDMRVFRITENGINSP